MLNRILKELRLILNADLALEKYGKEPGIVLVGSSVVRPKPMILLVSLGEDKLFIKNVLTFERSVRPKQITRFLRNIIEASSESLNLSIVDNRKSIDFVASTGEVINKISSLVSVLKDVLSEIPFLFPEYSRREYSRFGFQFAEKKLIIFDVRGIGIPFLAQELRFLKYPVLTLPDSDGKYFASSLGIDYLYFPLLSIVSEESNVYKVYKPVLQEDGEINLVSWDFRSELVELAKKFKQLLGDTEETKAIEKLVEKPYLLKKYISVLRRLLEKLDFGKKTPLSLIYRSPGIQSLADLGDIRKIELEEVAGKLRDMLEYLSTIIAMDNKLFDVILYRALIRNINKSMLIAMYRVIEQKIRKLQKFGGGFALYLSSEEVEKFLKGSLYVKVIFSEGEGGKHRIIIEPSDED